MFPKPVSKKFFGHPLRVGLYARVSTYDQKTLPLQVRAMREDAGKRNWTIAPTSQRSRLRRFST
jgi:hypothetical protein